MSEIVVFHHVRGLTEGVRRIADLLRAGGNTVHTPDLFNGLTYPSIEEGFAAVQALGQGVTTERADAVVARLPSHLVYIGISLGVMQAQRLAQTRPGAQGAILIEGCAPADAFANRWPQTVPVQVHGMQNDPFFGLEGDVDAARELITQTDNGELFVYPGDVHLFTDSSLPSYDKAATDQVIERIRTFLRTR